jgi:segregation and condensation protein B
VKDEKRLIEAALFMSARPMTVEEFRTLTGIGALGHLQKVVDELKSEYKERGIEIVESEGKYEMKAKTDLIEKVKQYAQDVELSKSALRTLAYLSQHDGILKSEVVKRIGPKVYEDVFELSEAGFIKAQKSGRSAKLILTEKFKRTFVSAIEKKKIEDKAQTSLASEVVEAQ